MPFISLLKESFATAPIEDRQAVIDKLAAANTEDAYYYQALMLLQKIYEEVMKQDEPVTPRQATDEEKELSKQMKNLLSKFSNHSQRFKELTTRFYLLIYPFETSTSIEFIKKGLHLESLDLQKPAATQEQDSLPMTAPVSSKSTAPSKLDSALINGENLIKQSFKEFSSSADGYSVIDLETLSLAHVAGDVNLWQSLSQLEKVALLKKLVNTPSERAFGSDVMQRLAKLWKEKPADANWGLEYLPFYNFTLNQLNELVQEIPEVVFLHESFVNAYLEKLIPTEYRSVDSISFWDDDANVLNGYLSRLDTFAGKLPSIYSNVNAAIKFHKLRIDIVRQDYSEERLLNYLSISSNNNSAQVLSPVPSRSGLFGFRDTPNNTASSDNVNTSIALPLLGPCVISDSDKRLVVQEYLTGLMAHEKLAVSMETLGAYLDYHNVLKPMFAEIMLTTPSAGATNQESWANTLGTNAYEALVSKSFVSFTSSTINASIKRKPSDAVKLQIKTKNINRLAIRVFQIDTENYWRIHLDDNDSVAANSNINLDGLCPTFEKDLDYSSEPALLVKTSKFVFGRDGLASDVFEGRGLWVVEFVGGQNQCRVIVQKGYLRHVMQETPAGHVARIINEDGHIVDKAKIWYNNQYYQADDSSNILIPYLPHDGNSKMSKVILISETDNFCEPASFYHEVEQYSLTASFYVNPEMINVSKKATVVVLPKLTLNGITVPLSVLQEKLVLHVNCTNANDVKTSSTCQNIDSKPSYVCFDFIVPEQLTSVEFHLKGKIKGMDGTQHEVTANRTISINAAFSDSGVPSSIQLQRTSDNYFIHVFGKNGEVKKDFEVSLRFKHAFVNRNIEVLLKTDQQGIIELGELKDIQWLEYSSSSTYKQWVLRDDTQSSLPPAICVSADKDFKIACPTHLPESLYSLYTTGVRSIIVKDVSCKIQKADGYITISGLPEGEYVLHIPSSSGSMNHIECTVIQGHADSAQQALWSNWLFGETKRGKQNGTVLKKPLTISSTSVSDESIQIQVENGSASKAFVVVTTSTFIPSSNDTLLSQLFDTRSLARPLSQQDESISTRSIFLNDKRIGEEYQYILNRSRAEKWVGSNLTKPSLLMYPKKNANTASNARHLEHGVSIEPAKLSRGMRMMKSAMFDAEGYSLGFGCDMLMSGVSKAMDSSLGFLDHQSPILVLPVPEDGIVAIDRQSLGYGGKFLQAVVISGEQTAYQQTVIDNNSSLKRKDLCQSESSNKALIRSKVISNVLPNNGLTLNTHEYEIIDSFEKLFDTIKTISRVGEDFAKKFSFLKTWLGLDLDSKLELHDEHACHELNLWLKKKDTAFFDAHVKPAVQSKIQKSFMDLYLLDQDLSLYQRDLYQFSQLSTVEKALCVTTQSKEFMHAVARSFKESFDNKKLDNRSDAIFDSILAHSATVLTEEPMNVVTEIVEVSTQSAPPPPPSAASRFSRSAAPNMYSAIASGSAASVDPTSPQYSPASPGFGAAAAYNASEEIEVDDDEMEEEVEEAVSQLREKAKEQRKKAAYKYTEPTSEWVETGYFYQDQVPLKQFWIDYIEHHVQCESGNGYFLSENFIYCLDSQAELFYVLTLMDLPFSSSVDWKIDASGDQGLVISASAQPLMVFYRTLTEHQGSFTSNSDHNLMLGQEIFVYDASASIDSEECIKVNPCSQALETSVEYGSHLIISNVSSKPLTCQVTVQVPTGSVPTQITSYCKSTTIRIEPYSTWHEVVGTFYFPSAGDYAIVPVTVSTSSGDTLIGMMDAMSIRVKEPCSSAASEDSAANDASSTSQSWSAIANNSSNEQVIAFLNSYRKLDKLDFSLISWRMGNRDFARSVFDTLKSRYFFAQDIWKYGISHQFHDVIGDLLLFQSGELLSQVGQVFESPLVVSNGLKQHELLLFDYYPLLNARAHPLKPTPEILNRQFYKQYNTFLDYLSLKTAAPSDADLIILALYLLLQDRISEAQTTFARIQSNVSPTHQVQYDYLDAYLKTRIPVTSDQEQMQQLDLQSIKDITSKYKDFGAARWRQLFTHLHDFVGEVEQGSLAVSDNTSQSKRILSEPILEFEVDQRRDELIVQYANIKSVEIKYYDMNIEVMFSNNPFMNSSTDKTSGENFNWIKPSYAVTMDLPEQKTAATEEQQSQDEDFDIIGVGQVSALQTVKIPFNGGNKNVFVEVSSGSIKRRQAYYANRLYTHLAESYGVVRVMSEKSKRPLAGAYVKVYARLKQGGAIHFWKDGYTGLNGVFDYIGVTEGNQLTGSNEKLKDLMMNRVDKLSILILSAEEGATVKEACPPNAAL
ncbi:conserved hypothetical protein [Mucor ambiguus]|uniref:Uncharacterized protein n=1 Tax=Mucor ambiguus TaxID=91626 RepID=A0A0C9LW15_9FUNG|nr:conserved hypothetical protein [Mucor ambiguus]